MKILIIDDESLDLFINRKLLSLEFEVEGFTSFEEGQSWIETNDFNVVLIDYYLGPGLFAHDVLQKIIALKGSNAFKAFVLSNYVDENQTRNLKEAGFIDVILKPLTTDSFKSKMENLT